MAININQHESVFLDTLRGWAAISVMLAHTFSWFIHPYHPNIETFVFVFSSGAVMLFFALSGFFITGSIANNITRHHNFNATKYIVDRIARLWPVLLLALLTTCIAYYVVMHYDLTCSTSCLIEGQLHAERNSIQLKLQNVLGSLVFLNGLAYGLGTPSMNGPLWSLSHEFWFYIIAALFTVSIINKRLWSSTLLLILFGYIIYAELYILLAGLIIWSIGAKTYLDKSSPVQSIFIKKYQTLFIVICFAVFSAAIFMFNLGFLRTGRYVLGISLAFAFYLIMTSTENSLIKKIHFFPSTSTCSYTLYAIHWPLIQLSYGAFIKYYQHWNTLLQILFLICLTSTIYLISKILSTYVENTAFFRAFFYKVLKIEH